jgi:hypothetical protein
MSWPEADVELAWRREVAARVAALDAGEIETIAWEEVRRRLLLRVREGHQHAGTRRSKRAGRRLS